VSTEGQSVEPQRVELLEYVGRFGWENVVEYSDIVSGSTFARAGLDRLLADVRRGRIGRVVIVKLDRIARSLRNMVQILAELDAHGVGLVVPSQGISSGDDTPAGRLQMAVLSAVSEFERSLTV
jgi:DNA invertase Pin-like site-specific DNA recombinase